MLTCILPLVICPDDTIFAKLQIESAIGALSKHRGNGYDYPKDHENNEGFFKRYPKGINTGLEEYPILLEEGQWNPGQYIAYTLCLHLE